MPQVHSDLIEGRGLDESPPPDIAPGKRGTVARPFPMWERFPAESVHEGVPDRLHPSFGIPLVLDQLLDSVIDDPATPNDEQVGNGDQQQKKEDPENMPPDAYEQDGALNEFVNLFITQLPFLAKQPDLRNDSRIASTMPPVPACPSSCCNVSEFSVSERNRLLSGSGAPWSYSRTWVSRSDLTSRAPDQSGMCRVTPPAGWPETTRPAAAPR